MGQSAGMDGYISKPIQVQRLVDEIVRVIPHSRVTAAVAVEVTVPVAALELEAP